MEHSDVFVLQFPRFRALRLQKRLRIRPLPELELEMTALVDQHLPVVGKHDARTLERHLIWSELDANPADPRDVTLIIRPAVNFEEGERYIVALSKLRDERGRLLNAQPPFRALRDRKPDPEIDARRAHFEQLFDTLRRAGIGRKDLYLAWDFTVASEEGLSGRALSIRNEAFEELGGVPEVVVPDNLKSAVVRAAFGVGGATALNRSYRELAKHFGFKVDPAPPYQPKKKGKVESAVKYVKRNFFPGQTERDIEVLAPRLARWVREIAGTREHGTTGKRPLEVFEHEERAVLKPLPAKRFEWLI